MMLTGHARLLQENDPRKVRFVYERGRWHESWEHNPRIARPNEKGDFQEYRPRQNYLRPYMVEKTDRRWTWKPYRPPRGELYFTREEEEFGKQHAGLVLIEPRLKPGASPNKQWGRWTELVALLKAAGLRVGQMGPNAAMALSGVEFVTTRTMRLAAAVMANARAAVLPEGGLHHVAAAVGTPAVVIFGGYISPMVTGYDGQVSLYVEDPKFPLGCGSRLPCPHCQRAMASITPERVMESL